MACKWNTGLMKTMKDPAFLVLEDSLIVIIKDMYPKSTYHFLVLPKENIASIMNVNCDNIKLLEHMDRTARKFVDDNFPLVNFRFGYHAQPSMQRLHLHVISNDMISNCLKTKKHWNSFTTEFFIPSTSILNGLKQVGAINLPSPSQCEKLLKKDLQCHFCTLKFSTMPKLKEHLYTHNS